VSNLATNASAATAAREPAVAAAESRPEATDRRAARPRTWPKLLRLLLLLLVFLWVTDTAISLAMQHTRLRSKLTALLEAAFGRNVEVESYQFSLWNGPTLVAHSISVGEDPRFGHEYFLRAETLTMRLRWLSLLRGRLDLGGVSLAHPSLNLVRNSDGDWNLAEWLPRPSGNFGMGPPTPAALATHPALRFTRMDVDSGRINFKRGDEKLPFAFIGVNGHIEPEGPGRWLMDLEATPVRAAVVSQQPGTLHLIGHMGGTSSRLRPAVLEISWTGASVPDVLRLARSYDYGVRGTMSLALTARTGASDWLIESRTELRQLHRWDLPMRADNPGLNFTATMHWNPLVPGIDIADASVEAPHSNAQFRSRILWGAPSIFQKRPVPPFLLEVRSAVIDLGDLLSCVRAFHTGVSENVSVRGAVEGRANLSGWPLQLVNAYVDNIGADLTGPGLRVPVHLGQIEFHYDHGIDFLEPLTLSFGSAANTLRLEAPHRSRASQAPALHLSGNLAQVRDLLSTAAALGWNISHGWNLAGPVRGDLHWSGGTLPWQSPPVGFVEWGGEGGTGSLAAAFLNRPVDAIRARAEWKRGSRQVALSSAEAFGARWAGTFERRDTGEAWQFALSANHLDAANLDRWLNPRWRESFLGRVLPFLNDRSRPNAAPENLRADGTIAIDQFTLAPLTLHQLQADVRLEGRNLRVASATAGFHAGKISGVFDAALASPPSYHANLDFSGVDLAALTAVSPGLADLFAGLASGKISLDARGAAREELIGALACEGSARIQRPELRSPELADILRQPAGVAGSNRFQDASAEFTCAHGAVQFQRLELVSPGGGIEGSGSIDFAHNLVFHLTRVTESHRSAGPAYNLSGTLADPRITRAPAPSARP